MSKVPEQLSNFTRTPPSHLLSCHTSNPVEYTARQQLPLNVIVQQLNRHTKLLSNACRDGVQSRNSLRADHQLLGIDDGPTGSIGGWLLAGGMLAFWLLASAPCTASGGQHCSIQLLHELLIPRHLRHNVWNALEKHLQAPRDRCPAVAAAATDTDDRRSWAWREC